MEVSSSHHNWHHHHHHHGHHRSRSYHHPNPNRHLHRDDNNDNKKHAIGPCLHTSFRTSHCIPVLGMLIASILILSSRLFLGLFQTKIRRETKLQQFGNASRWRSSTTFNWFPKATSLVRTSLFLFRPSWTNELIHVGGLETGCGACDPSRFESRRMHGCDCAVFPRRQTPAAADRHNPTITYAPFQYACREIVLS